MTRTHLVKTLFLILIITFSTAAGAKKKGTELEQFYAKRGIVVVREIYPVGYTYNSGGYLLYVKAVVLYLPGRSDKVIKGIKIDLMNVKTGSVLITSYVDSTEIPSLYTAISYMVKTAPKIENSNIKTDLIYITEGDFQVAVQHSIKGKQKNRFYGLIKSGRDSFTYEFTDRTEMKKLNGLLRQAVKVLNAHRKKLPSLKKPAKGTTSEA